MCFGALLREEVCYIGTGFAESPATCGNFIKVFICDRSVPQGEQGEKDQQVSTRPSHINLAAALTAENHGSHSGTDLCLTYRFCPQVCNFPRCKVMKARRKKKKKEEALQQEQIGFFNQVLCSAASDCAAMFCVPWLNTIRGRDECEQGRNGTLRTEQCLSRSRMQFPARKELAILSV